MRNLLWVLAKCVEFCGVSYGDREGLVHTVRACVASLKIIHVCVRESSHFKSVGV